MTNFRKPQPTMLDAMYCPAVNTAHRGNICIEALPRFVSAEDMSKAFGQHPPFDASERNLPKADRLMQILSLRDLFEPLTQQEELCNRIGTMIRAGYANRNPVVEDAHKRQVEFYRRAMAGEIIAINPATCSTAASVAVYGGSGVGKTSLVRRILDFVPQVLWHGHHGIVQIVWLRLECPPDGSPKQLLMHFLRKVDALIDSGYAKEHHRTGFDELIGAVATVAARHNVGLIVLDEIQRLLLAKGRRTSTLLNFFVSLANEVQVPILYVGTRAARRMLGMAPFEQARRTGENGSFTLEPLKRGSDWDRLITSLLDYQWTQHVVDADPETEAGKAERERLSEALFYESQGILALVVRLFQLAQAEAIESGDERVTPELIHDVAARRFSVLRPVLEGLRGGRDVSRYDMFFEAGLKTLEAKVELITSPAGTTRRGAPNPREGAVQMLSQVYREEHAVAAVDLALRLQPDLDAAELAQAALAELLVNESRPSRSNRPTLRQMREAAGREAPGAADLVAAVNAEADRMMENGAAP